MWGHAQKKVHTTPPETIEDPKEAVKQQLPMMTPEMCQRTFDSSCDNCQVCAGLCVRHRTANVLKTLRKLMYTNPKQL